MTLTSPDPEYREELKKITGILSTLGEKEKFFFVDEFGPFAVKIQGGRLLVKRGEVKTYPQMQVSKGKLICTALQRMLRSSKSRRNELILLMYHIISYNL